VSRLHTADDILHGAYTCTPTTATSTALPPLPHLRGLTHRRILYSFTRMHLPMYGTLIYLDILFCVSSEDFPVASWLGRLLLPHAPFYTRCGSLQNATSWDTNLLRPQFGLILPSNYLRGFCLTTVYLGLIPRACTCSHVYPHHLTPYFCVIMMPEPMIE
jgi:hypothetical protein